MVAMAADGQHPRAGARRPRGRSARGALDLLGRPGVATGIGAGTDILGASPASPGGVARRLSAGRRSRAARRGRTEMKTIATVSLLVALFAFAAPALAQTSRVESGSTSLGGLVFSYETHLAPPVPPLGDGLNMLVLTTPPATVHRVMLDRVR